MEERDALVNRVFSVANSKEFAALAIDIFSYQVKYNNVYRRYIQKLGIPTGNVSCLEDIPFLPVSFFKTHRVKSGNFRSDAIFHTSGTTGRQTGRHYIKNLALYRKSLREGFELFYGNPGNYCIIALVPESSGILRSSLFYMSSRLIEWSENKLSGLYLNRMESIPATIEKLKKKNEKTILFGVSFALLDLAEKYGKSLDNVILMETGGMKGRRKEITRNELHSVLEKQFQVESVHSEYGMTELMSQAYSKKGGQFECPPWMKIFIRDMYDPFEFLPAGKSGAVNIIDLANIDSCSFIETSDLGKINSNGTFEILGRFDHSDLRGCSLLLDQ